MPSVIESVRCDVAQLVRAHPSVLKAAAVVLNNRGLQAILLYRISNALWRKRIPLLPMILTRISQHLFAVDIAYQADIGPGVVIVHGFGLVVGVDVRIEGNCVLYHGVTLGARGSEWVGSRREDGHPTVEADVMIGAGAKVLGPVRIGQNSVIGANAVVTRDIPPNSVVAGIPGRVIAQRPEMDANLRPVGGSYRLEKPEMDSAQGEASGSR